MTSGATGEEPVARALGPVGLLGARISALSGHRAELVHALIRFAVTGLVSVIADVGILALLHSGLGVSLLPSTLISYTAGLVVSYSLNRRWTFKATGSHRRTLIRFGVLVGFNVGSTLLIVLGLTHIGVYYLLAKLVAVAINAAVNFFASKHWVYASPPDRPSVRASSPAS
jgi:putative flippase GtrA